MDTGQFAPYRTVCAILRQLINSEVKIANIGQCIAKAALRKSLIFPILFALAFKSDHMFGSKLLNLQLFRLRFAESYSKFTSFKQAFVMAEDIGGIPQPNAAEENFTTFVSLIVSVDYSIATTNDRGTPHGMRVIAAIPLIRNHYETDGTSMLQSTSLLKGILITSYDFQ